MPTKVKAGVIQINSADGNSGIRLIGPTGPTSAGITGGKWSDIMKDMSGYPANQASSPPSISNNVDYVAPWDDTVQWAWKGPPDATNTSNTLITGPAYGAGNIKICADIYDTHRALNIAGDFAQVNAQKDPIGNGTAVCSMKLLTDAPGTNNTVYLAGKVYPNKWVKDFTHLDNVQSGQWPFNMDNPPSNDERKDMRAYEAAKNFMLGPTITSKEFPQNRVYTIRPWASAGYELKKADYDQDIHGRSGYISAYPKVAPGLGASETGSTTSQVGWKLILVPGSINKFVIRAVFIPGTIGSDQNWDLNCGPDTTTGHWISSMYNSMGENAFGLPTLMWYVVNIPNTNLSYIHSSEVTAPGGGYLHFNVNQHSIGAGRNLWKTSVYGPHDGATHWQWMINTLDYADQTTKPETGAAFSELSFQHTGTGGLTHALRGNTPALTNIYQTKNAPRTTFTTDPLKPITSYKLASYLDLWKDETWNYDKGNEVDSTDRLHGSWKKPNYMLTRGKVNFLEPSIAGTLGVPSVKYDNVNADQCYQLMKRAQENETFKYFKGVRDGTPAAAEFVTPLDGSPETQVGSCQLYQLPPSDTHGDFRMLASKTVLGQKIPAVNAAYGIVDIPVAADSKGNRQDKCRSSVVDTPGNNYLYTEFDKNQCKGVQLDTSDSKHWQLIDSDAVMDGIKDNCIQHCNTSASRGTNECLFCDNFMERYCLTRDQCILPDKNCKWDRETYKLTRKDDPCACTSLANRPFSYVRSDKTTILDDFKSRLDAVSSVNANYLGIAAIGGATCVYDGCRNNSTKTYIEGDARRCTEKPSNNCISTINVNALGGSQIDQTQAGCQFGGLEAGQQNPANKVPSGTPSGTPIKPAPPDDDLIMGIPKKLFIIGAITILVILIAIIVAVSMGSSAAPVMSPYMMGNQYPWMY